MTETTRGWLASLGPTGRPDEDDTKRLLRAHGLRTPAALRVPAGRAGPPDPDFPGPYVVKVRSAEVPHKSEAGGVVLGVDRGGLAAAAETVASRFPGCGLLVEQQVAYSGPEFIVGGFLDPVFGPAVMVGAGGILTELYRDVAFRLVPCSEREVLRMLGELAVHPALEGFRGLPLDARALSGAVARVSAIIEELGAAFSQLDVNPIVFARSGWTVLDAKLVLAASQRGDGDVSAPQPPPAEPPRRS